MSQAAALSRAVATPAHIPESAVYDFDMFHDPVYLADPPEHGQYRAPPQQAFSPKAMLALKDEIRTLANQRKIMTKKFHGGHVIGVETLCLLWDV